MILSVLSTGSKGNCYALQAGGEILLLDAGVPVKEISSKAKPFNTVVGALITHEHQDHCKAVIQLAGRGIDCYATKGTFDAITPQSALNCRLHEVASGTQFDVGNFTVLPFRTEHDAAEPVGFLVHCKPTKETLLYATDTYYLHNRFDYVDYWLIECNYIDDLLSDDEVHRLKRSHMSLANLLKLFAANDLSTAEAIILVHLSDTHSDEARMIAAVESQTKVKTKAAENGAVYSLTSCPF